MPLAIPLGFIPLAQRINKSVNFLGDIVKYFIHDALGGVVHYFTKTPRINSKDKIKNSFSSNFNTANESFVHHFDTELSFKNWASYSSISISKFGNLRMGENRKHGYDAWGLVPFYSENKGRKYVAQPTVNSNPNIQKNSVQKNLIYPITSIKLLEVPYFRTLDF